LQDEGSQIAALIAASGKPRQVVDICAGGGGKTLALAASMANAGQLYAYDGDRLRLQPIFARIKRAGVRNAQVLRARDTEALAALGPKFDLVLVDAPCTGTGVWRRRPESKWRLKLPSIANRQSDQREVLELAAPLVRPGGRLVYVTCSVLPEENTDQVDAFLQRHPQFRQISARDCLATALDAPAPASADGREDSLLLTPGSVGTDGFFVAVLERDT
jgi:16S rRNA (cytosine967-C5)-methyltransferase